MLLLVPLLSLLTFPPVLLPVPLDVLLPDDGELFPVFPLVPPLFTGVFIVGTGAVVIVGAAEGVTDGDGEGDAFVFLLACDASQKFFG